MAHSEYSPSRLERIIACPGSVALIRKLKRDGLIPNEEQQSDYAARGTFLHKVFQHIVVGASTYADFDLDIADRAAVQDCIDFYNNIVKGIGHSNIAYGLEQEIDLSDWGLPEIYGTADAFIYDIPSQHMHVPDWKFGSIWVTAYRNPQLMAYAAGLLGWPTSVKKITVYVGQPAHDNWDSWTIPINDLYTWVHRDTATAICKSWSTPPVFNAGEKQCRWCEAAAHCTFYLTMANEIAMETFLLADMGFTDVDHDRLLKTLDTEPFMKNIYKSIRLYVQNTLENGKTFPGMKLVQGRSNRKWKYPEAKIAKWLSKHTEIDEIFRSKLISPNQAEQLQRSLKQNKVFQKLFHKPPGKVTVARDTDARPALPSASAATEAFKEFVES